MGRKQLWRGEVLGSLKCPRLFVTGRLEAFGSYGLGDWKYNCVYMDSIEREKGNTNIGFLMNVWDAWLLIDSSALYKH